MKLTPLKTIANLAIRRNGYSGLILGSDWRTKAVARNEVRDFLIEQGRLNLISEDTLDLMRLFNGSCLRFATPHNLDYSLRGILCDGVVLLGNNLNLSDNHAQEIHSLMLRASIS